MPHATTTASFLLGPSAIPAGNRGRSPVVSKSLMRNALALTILVAAFLGAAPIDTDLKFAIFGAFIIVVFCGILRVQDCIGRYIARRSPVLNPGVEFPRRVAKIAERISTIIAAENGLAAISGTSLDCTLGDPSTLLYTPVRLRLLKNGRFTEVEVTPEYRSMLLSGLCRREIAYLSLLIGNRLTVIPLPTPSNHAILAELVRRRSE